MHSPARLVKPYVLRLAALPYVQEALSAHADLRAFHRRPTPRILTGIFLIVVSFPLGLPAVAGTAALAVSLDCPWIAILGPVLYGLSHLVFLAGIYLSGVEYTAIFLRWLIRVSVERLLKWQGLDPEGREG